MPSVGITASSVVVTIQTLPAFAIADTLTFVDLALTDAAVGDAAAVTYPRTATDTLVFTDLGVTDSPPTVTRV